jgi:hypothetical protein
MDQHDEFLELCALSTSGELTEEERRKLQAHLAACADCRQALKEFEAAADVGMPLLASKLGEPAGEFELPRVTPIGLVSPSAASSDGEENRSSDLEKRIFAFAHRQGPRARVNGSYVWVPFAACVLLSMVLATYTYRAGKRNGHLQVVFEVAPVRPVADREALEEQISDIDHERQKLQSQLGERDKAIAELGHEIDQQSASLAQMKTDQAQLEQSFEADETDKQRGAEERASLAEKLDAAQASVLKMQQDLASERQARAEGGTQDASLGAQIVDLNRQLRDREQAINAQQELLSHDRDIRDLMGARDLYIAEVYDVGRDGETRRHAGESFTQKGNRWFSMPTISTSNPASRTRTVFKCGAGVAQTCTRL